jgi:lipid-A-disaccharide synthase
MAVERLRIGIVAGEASGDILGGGLLRALHERVPNLEIRGVGGDRMLAQGLRSEFPMERLSIMGLVEVLGRLPELLRRRRNLAQALIDFKPDLFIGIDAPDFNLDLEGKLRDAGIPTVHYVSPSVWAWRRKRIFKIMKTTDLMLTLLPFEARFYEEQGMPVCFVGHPLANEFPLEPDMVAARHELGISQQGQYVALLPGSRGGEVKQLAVPFLETARWLKAQRPDLRFIIPSANERRHEQLQVILDTQFADLEVELVPGNSRQVMTASDVILIASGTATLEAMLCKKPMVVAYRMAPLTYRILSRLIKSRYISLPNLLAGESLVPEVLQDKVKPEVLGPMLLQSLENTAETERLVSRFTALHELLRRDADQRAAEAVLALVKARQGA